MKKILFLLTLALYSCAEPRPQRYSNPAEMPIARRGDKMKLVKSVLVADEAEQYTPIDVAVISGSPNDHIEMLAAKFKGKRIKALAFIERYSHIAYRMEVLYQIPAEIILAQGMLESDFGTSDIAKASNNLFSIKAYQGDSWDKREGAKYVCGKGISWRKYETPNESFYDHSEFLQDNAPSLFRGGKITPARIAATGYAGSSKAQKKKYRQDLENIIEVYELDKLFQ
jgi:flagellum-specific peptidoglycan hydrolase FlgJ